MKDRRTTIVNNKITPEHINVEITASKARTGCTVPILLNDLTVSLDIPAGAKNGDRFEVRSRNDALIGIAEVTIIDDTKKKGISDKKRLYAAIVGAVLIIAGIVYWLSLGDTDAGPGPTDETDITEESDLQSDADTEAEGDMYYGGYFDPVSKGLVNDPYLYTDLKYSYSGNKIKEVKYHISTFRNSGEEGFENDIKRIRELFNLYVDFYSAVATPSDEYIQSEEYMNYKLSSNPDDHSELCYSNTPYILITLENQHAQELNPLKAIDISSEEKKLIESAAGLGFRSEIGMIKENSSTNPDNAAVSGNASSEYLVGKEYTLQENLKVRDGASIDARQKKRSELTSDAFKNSAKDEYAVLKKGTQVTCLEIKGDWMRIPSGWICCKEGDTIYVK